MRAIVFSTGNATIARWRSHTCHTRYVCMQRRKSTSKPRVSTAITATHNDQGPEKHIDEQDDETDDLRPLSQVTNKCLRLVPSDVVDDPVDEAMD